MRPFALAAALPFVLLVPAASEGQEPHSTHDTTAPFDCGVDHLDSLRVASEYQRVGDPSTTPVRIDVLALKADSGLHDILIARAFRDTVRYVEESGSGIDLRLVGVEPAPADLAAVADRMRQADETTRLGVADQIKTRARSSYAVNQIRRRVGADLVVVFSPAPRSGGDFGKADLPSRPDRRQAFAVVAARSQHTLLLAHEIGHTLGLAHQPGDSGVPLRRYGRPYIGSRSGRSYSTIMANPTVGFRLAAFSRPGYHDGWLVGDANHDSGRAMRSVARSVAAYEAEVHDRAYDPYKLTLHDRFEVNMRYVAENSWYWARVVNVDLPGDATGLLYFFSPDNAEVLVKVLNGCGVNGHWWVFGAAATDLRFEIEVRDTRTGESKRYTNPAGESPRAVSDIGAFRCR